jgi:hypothetical protein
MRMSGEYSLREGKLERCKRMPAIRGLNQNHSHDLKNVFKSAATQASHSSGVLGDFYKQLLDKGVKPTMARLTLARKIAAIVLKIWKKGGHFDPERLRQQAA